MNVSGHTVQPPLRLVVSSAVPARPGDGAPRPLRLQVVIDDQRRLQLMDTMALVGNARAHASRRLAHKQALARRALTLLIATSVCIWSWIALDAASLDPSAHRRLAFVAIISAVAALVLSCCRSEGRAAVAAHQLRVCAAEISELRARLSACRAGERVGADAESVQEIHELYRDTMRRCTADHAYVDYRIARTGRDAMESSRWRVDFYYLFDVYSLPVAALTLPLLFAAVL